MNLRSFLFNKRSLGKDDEYKSVDHMGDLRMEVRELPVDQER